MMLRTFLGAVTLTLFVVTAACSDDNAEHGDAGPIDSGIDGSIDASNGTDAQSDAGAARCLHDPCREGALLDATCSACTARVCEIEEWCCYVRWEAGCVDLALENSDVCTCAPETECGNLIDEDRDGIFDCDDEDCHTGGACEPGKAAVGEACETSSDCASDGDDPLCVTAERFEWPGGFCTEFCTLEEDDCPEGAECQDIGLGGGRGVCQVTCDIEDPSCRDGYECREDRGSGPYCQPKLEVCDNGIDDDLDGKTDCAEWDCIFDPHCEEICDNGIDDNDNGAVDCEEVGCVDLPACSDQTHAACEGVPETRQSCVTVGERQFPCDPVTNAGCLSGQSCELAGGTFLCFGHPNDVGLCERCGGLRGRCAAGMSCMTVTSARCAAFCCDDSDCGPNGVCNHAYINSNLSRTDSPVGVCFAR